MIVKNLALGLMLIEDLVTDPGLIINRIENLNKIHMESNGNSIWQPWQDGQNDIFCYQKKLIKPAEIPQGNKFPEEETYLYETITGITDLAVNEYCKEYPFAKPNLKGREDPNVLKYVGGGFLPEHQDHGVSSRALTVLVYLNDDYEGGDISLPHCGVTLKPPAGSVLMFPSNFIYSHTISEMKSGVRYAIPAWFHNRKDMYNSDGSE